jgi:hypothetical protein
VQRLMFVAGFIEEDETKGPTVTFKDLSLTVVDPRSPVGYKTVLHPMTGRFEWVSHCSDLI